jgi:hypothetical protein
MIRTLFTFLVLACVMGLSGMLTGRLWERYLDETGSLGFTGIYERLLAAQAGFADDADTTTRARLIREASALEE